ncbi:hypothetical protein BJ508DRAFT_329903 [Ascobolus immersus RN42]|uniref:Uncharacterized protein n=1 Tax=Ascobolus immersus RN42 TaxID=1160509 RepID=A0A3N4HVR2_ASCIM|nr:hypothetical protein BJ508DRAFT_329903 [Ascobolus immersus RN42]
MHCSPSRLAMMLAPLILLTTAVIAAPVDSGKFTREQAERLAAQLGMTVLLQNGSGDWIFVETPKDPVPTEIVQATQELDAIPSPTAEGTEDGFDVQSLVGAGRSVDDYKGGVLVIPNGQS